MKPDTILKELAADYWNVNTSEIHCIAFAQGASGRILCRLQNGEQTAVGVYWTLERADNDAFVAASRQLAEEGVHVPTLLRYVPLNSPQGELEGGLALISDLGDCTLLSCKRLPWGERKKLYVDALLELHKLQQTEGHEQMQPEFDENLYGWEQCYFGEHYLGTHLKQGNWGTLIKEEWLDEMVRKLVTLPRTVIHRDFQSQNVMVSGNQIFLIDYQGMRKGLAEYDVASLLYDAYADLTEEERAELWEEWVNITDGKADRETFFLCSCQRIIQALGAFANIGYNKGNTWYLEQIPVAEKFLLEVLQEEALFNHKGSKLVEVLKKTVFRK